MHCRGDKWGATGRVLAPLQVSGGVGTDATSVLVRVQLTLRAVRIAANGRFVLMGWDDSDWRAVATMVEHHENVLFQRAMKLRGSRQR